MSIVRLTAKARRKIRVKAKITGSSIRPRLSVFRANKFIYAQLIDDKEGITLAAVSDKEIKAQKAIDKMEKAKLAGQLLAEKALKKKISTAVFDRGSNRFHGRVKAFADGARNGGLKI